MVEGIVVSLVVAFLGWVASGLWRNRRQLTLLLFSMRLHRRVRVSVAVLLRVQDDDNYVLVHSPLRPNVYGPFGGAVKYRAGARARLDALRFQEEPRADLRMAYDLRGFLPFTSLPAFGRWLATQEERESATECLKRELAEELGEVGHPELSGYIAGSDFRRIRTITDGPRKVPGQDYHQVRFFEVWDLDLTDQAAVSLRDGLLRIARDLADTGVICVDVRDIRHGRHRMHYIAPQSAFLIGPRRLHADLPMPR